MVPDQGTNGPRDKVTCELFWRGTHQTHKQPDKQTNKQTKKTNIETDIIYSKLDKTTLILIYSGSTFVNIVYPAIMGKNMEIRWVSFRNLETNA